MINTSVIYRITILGFIFDLIILPLHIIINPVILYYVINTKKYDEKEKEIYIKSSIII